MAFKQWLGSGLGPRFDAPHVTDWTARHQWDCRVPRYVKFDTLPWRKVTLVGLLLAGIDLFPSCIGLFLTRIGLFVSCISLFLAFIGLFPSCHQSSPSIHRSFSVMHQSFLAVLSYDGVERGLTGSNQKSNDPSMTVKCRSNGCAWR